MSVSDRTDTTKGKVLMVVLLSCLIITIINSKVVEVIKCSPHFEGQGDVKLILEAGNLFGSATLPS